MATINSKDNSKTVQTSFVQRTLVLAKPSTSLQSVCLALGLQSKNLFNTTHFCVNQVISAYEKVSDDSGVASYKLKSELHANQLTAIGRFNTVIADINSKRLAKYQAKLAMGGKEAEKAKLVVLPSLEAEVSSVYRSVLDQTVLDNVLRGWIGLSGEAVYGRLPAKSAQQVIRRYLNSWSGFFEATKVFAKGGSAITGRPKPPGYMAKSDRFVVELPLTQMGDCMIGLGKRSIPVDFEETVSLTESEMDAWNGYRVLDRVAQACKQRGFGSSFEAQHLRIVPVGRTIKFEVVVRVQRELDPNSMLAKIECSLGDDLKDAKGAKTNELLIGSLRIHKELSGLQVAGVDFGVKNTASIAFGNGQRAIVIGSGRLESFLDSIDAKLDALVSSLTSPDIRAFSAKQTELLALGQKLSRPDLALLRKGLKSIFANPEYRELRGKRERWLSDYLHKLSLNLVGECAKRGVEAIVLGQNKGWKDGMNMGVTQNRRFGNVPIARLIELIRYKANAQGLVVVTTEESFTSKTSFVNNEALKVFEKARVKKSKKESNEEVAKTSVECAANAYAPEVQVEEQTPPMGKRLKDKRNTFVNHYQTGRWAMVHADVNAAFNIIRKVFMDFVYTDKLTLKYNLMRVSPRLGLTHVRI